MLLFSAAQCCHDICYLSDQTLYPYSSEHSYLQLYLTSLLLYLLNFMSLVRLNKTANISSLGNHADLDQITI